MGGGPGLHWLEWEVALDIDAVDRVEPGGLRQAKAQLHDLVARGWQGPCPELGPALGGVGGVVLNGDLGRPEAGEGVGDGGDLGLAAGRQDIVDDEVVDVATRIVHVEAADDHHLDGRRVRMRRDLDGGRGGGRREDEHDGHQDGSHVLPSLTQEHRTLGPSSARLQLRCRNPRGLPLRVIPDAKTGPFINPLAQAPSNPVGDRTHGE